MNRLDILKAFLQDDEIIQKYGIKQKEIDTLTMTQVYSNDFMNFIQHFVNTAEDEKLTEIAIASNLIRFLENRLRKT